MMNPQRTNVRSGLSLAISLLLIIFANGCSIEESDQGLTGSIQVSLLGPDSASVAGAEIYVDEMLQPQHTPATIAGVPVGSRVLRLSRPGYLDATQTVEVAFKDTVAAALHAEFAPLAVIGLSDVPAGTTLLVNTLPLGTTPPDLFNVGIGSYVISAYLPGFATDLPARWNRDLAAGDTVVLTPHFTQVATGAHPDSLAPVFALLDDRDSTRLRLADYRGRICVVTFFYYYCAPCLAEFPYIQATYSSPDYAGKVEFFGVDSQDPWSLFERYRREHPTLGLTFPLVYDPPPAAQTTHDFQVLVHPANFVIDKTGRVRYRFGQITESVLRGAIDALLAEGE